MEEEKTTPSSPSENTTKVVENESVASSQPEDQNTKTTEKEEAAEQSETNEEAKEEKDPQDEQNIRKSLTEAIFGSEDDEEEPAPEIDFGDSDSDNDLKKKTKNSMKRLKKSKEGKSSKRHRSSKGDKEKKKKRRRSKKQDETEGAEKETAEGEQIDQDQQQQQQEEEAGGEGEEEQQHSGGEEEFVASESQSKNFFDEIMDSIKTSRRRKPKYSEDQLYEVVAKFNEKMQKAYEQDNQSIAKGQPGLEKLKLLNEVANTLSMKHLESTHFKHGSLKSVKLWLDPLADGSLPNLTIRTRLLQCLSKMNFNTLLREDLSSSDIGQAVMHLYRHPKEIPENKRICSILIEKWSRLIFGLSTEYRDNEDIDTSIGMERQRSFSRPSLVEADVINLGSDKKSTSTASTSSSSSGTGASKSSTSSSSSSSAPKSYWPRPTIMHFTKKPVSNINVEDVPKRKVDPKRAGLEKTLQNFKRLKPSNPTEKPLKLAKGK